MIPFGPLVWRKEHQSSIFSLSCFSFSLRSVLHSSGKASDRGEMYFSNANFVSSSTIPAAVLPLPSRNVISREVSFSFSLAFCSILLRNSFSSSIFSLFLSVVCVFQDVSPENSSEFTF